ncbi:MAG TPA: hypothetical protein VM370_09165 [Candidatus Thermoplasmatota archaeon]|nr:hypothetical protein [Candidatus Thermoplasmatota archaeon]
MDARVERPRWDRRHHHAWGGLEVLLQAHPEGVPGIEALDRILEYGLDEQEGILLFETLRDREMIVVSGGRWRLA